MVEEVGGLRRLKNFHFKDRLTHFTQRHKHLVVSNATSIKDKQQMLSIDVRLFIVIVLVVVNQEETGITFHTLIQCAFSVGVCNDR